MKPEIKYTWYVIGVMEEGLTNMSTTYRSLTDQIIFKILHFTISNIAFNH